MKILRDNNDKFIRINGLTDIKTDAGWQENAKEFEEQTLEKIINPIENYETVRYIHKPYSGLTSSVSDLQSDIWFYFYFRSGNTGNVVYVQNYEPTGLTNKENAKMLRQSTESFFRLEFYKTPNDESPDRSNRRLVFAKNLALPVGEKFYLTSSTVNDNIYVPVFMGSNYRNKENMYFYWFQDESAFNELTLTGNTFYMTAKYFNAVDGTITDFVNTCMSTSTNVIESEDLYYKVVIDKSDYSYEVYQFTGTTGSTVGYRTNPIKFYEKGGSDDCGTLIPSPTPTPTITASPTPTVTTTSVTPTPSATTGFVPTPTPTPSQTAAPTLYAYYIGQVKATTDSDSSGCIDTYDFCLTPGYTTTYTVYSQASDISQLLSYTLYDTDQVTPYAGAGTGYKYPVSDVYGTNTYTDGQYSYYLIEVSNLGAVNTFGYNTCNCGGGGGGGTVEI